MPRFFCLRVLMLACCVFALGADPWVDHVQTGDWAAGRRAFEDAIVAECTGPGEPSFDKVAKLLLGRNICRVFPAISERALDETERANLTKWLLANGDFTEKLLLALEPSDDPGRAFELLYRILKRYGKRVARYENLTVAFLVVWDTEEPSTISATSAYDYFTQSSTKTSFGLRSMPWQLSKYVVDSTRSRDERKWCQSRYAGWTNIDRIYDKIWKDDYDEDYFLRGEPKEVEEKAKGDVPTLAEIRRYGGVCHEAAVLASEVGKNVGVPAVYIRGTSPGGIPHAWVGFLKGKKNPKWDMDTGRLGDDDDKFIGTLVDPQSGRTVEQHALELALAALKTSSSKRRKARIWAEAALILNNRTDEGKKAAARAIETSLKASLFDRAQWRIYARLAADGAIDKTDLIRRAVELPKELDDYPGMAVDAFDTLITALPDIELATQRKLCDTLAKSFRKKSSAAVARIRLIEGRLVELSGDSRSAAKIYKDAAEYAVDNKNRSGLLLRLLDSAGRVYVARNDVDEAISLHKDVFGDLKKPGRSYFVQYTTWFQTGLRLAALYAEDGNDTRHSRIVREITDRIRADSDDRERFETRFERVRYSQLNTTRPPRR
jgi:hypothetical protein